MKGTVMMHKRYVSLKLLAALCMASGFSHSTSQAVTIESAKETVISAGKRTLKGINFVCKNGLVATGTTMLLTVLLHQTRYAPSSFKQASRQDISIVIAASLCQAAWNLLTHSTSAINDLPQKDGENIHSKIKQLAKYSNTVLENGGACALATTTVVFSSLKALEYFDNVGEINMKKAIKDYRTSAAFCALFFAQPTYNISAHYIRKYWNARKQNTQTNTENESEAQRRLVQPVDESVDGSISI